MKKASLIISIICYSTAITLLFAASPADASNRVIVGGVSCFIPIATPDSSSAKRLECGYYKQTTKYTCGPAAVMNLLYYYKMLSAKEMTSHNEMRISNEMGTTEDGTSQSQMETWLSEHGFRVDSGNMISSDELISNINKGIPTLMLYDCHWMLARGYIDGDTPTNSFIIFSDSSTGNTMIDRETIDTMWGAAHMPKSCNRDVGYYIVAIPQHAVKR